LPLFQNAKLARMNIITKILVDQLGYFKIYGVVWYHAYSLKQLSCRSGLRQLWNIFMISNSKPGDRSFKKTRRFRSARNFCVFTVLINTLSASATSLLLISEKYPR